MPESAFLVQISENPDRWELRDVIPQHTCFSRGYVPDTKALAAGTIQACEGAAKLLGYHVDGIYPILVATPQANREPDPVLSMWPYPVRR